MLTAGCLRFNAAGRVVSVPVGGVVVNFNGGTPTTSDGSLALSSQTPEAYLGGMGYRLDGKLCDTAVDAAGAIVSHNGGIPYTAAGKIAVGAGPPVLLGAFSDGFSEGFS